MAPPPDSGLAGAGQRSIFSQEGGGGTLPSWAAYGAFVGSLAFTAAVLGALGWFTIALMLVFGALVSVLAIYAWSRAVEGRRRAKDRAVTIAIVGTLVITACAVVISVPIGIMAAIYMNEYGRGPLRRALTFFVDVMTGIPSIVAGLFAYALFELFLGPGIRMGIMGSIALTVLMIPIVIRSAEEVLKIVPQHLREASYALGTPKWQTIVKVVLPPAFAGLVTGVMIATARIIGETAPLLVTTGVVDSLNANPFQGRMQNLAVYAYNEYRSPGVMKQASYDRAWAAALTLIAIVMILNVIARLVYRRYKTEIR